MKKLTNDQRNQLKAVLATLALALILLLSAFCGGCSLLDDDDEEEEVQYVTIPTDISKGCVMTCKAVLVPPDNSTVWSTEGRHWTCKEVCPNEKESN